MILVAIIPIGGGLVIFGNLCTDVQILLQSYTLNDNFVHCVYFCHIGWFISLEILRGVFEERNGVFKNRFIQSNRLNRLLTEAEFLKQSITATKVSIFKQPKMS